MTTTEVRAAATVDASWHHLPALDGMRALAVIAVLVFHGGYLRGGFLGVDLFFALSGYLITSLLIRDAEGSGIRLAAFWGRRFRRLLPAVFAMIAIVAVWSFALGSPADVDGVKRDGPWAVVYLANWHFISRAQGYWASFAQPSMFDHLWSLAIEEQFYVIWPIAVLAIWKFSRRPQRFLVIATSIGALASVAVMLSLYDGGDPTRSYMGTDTRAASLLVGAFAATEPAKRWARRVVAALGERIDLLVAGLGVLVLWAWITVDGASAESLYRGGLLVHSTACAGLIALIGAASTGRAVRTLGWRPLAWIGTLSYGLYLWHWPIFVVVSPSRMGFDGVHLLAVRIGLSFLFAIVSYRIIEDPIRHRAAWARGAAGVLAAVCSVVALLSLLWILPAPPTEIAAFELSPVAGLEDPVDTRTSEQLNAAPTTTLGRIDVQAEVERSEVERAEVEPPDEGAAGTNFAAAIAAFAPATTTSSLPAAPEPIGSVIWAGDSVAVDMALPVVEALDAAGVTVASAADYGLRVAGPSSERRILTHLATRLATDPRDTIVMPISSWDADVSTADYQAGLVAFVDVLARTGSAHPRLIVVTGPPVDESTDVELDRLASAVNELAKVDERIDYVDASEVWARPVVLDENGDGAPERKRDMIHVCPAGAAKFAAWFVLELDARFDGIAPVDPSVWAAGSWATDPRYDEPVGACAPV